MSRAVMLRLTVYGALGLGAAMLIAALLLPTYTVGQITKIPLDIDTALVSEGHGTALDPASLTGEHFVINEDVPLVGQQQISVESPANADVVTLQVGSTLRRSDKQKDTGLLLAIIDTVTVDRRTAEAVSDDTHPGGSVQQPRMIEDDNPPKPLPLTHEGLTYRFPFHTEKMTYRFFDPIAQEAFDANYAGEEDVNGLTAYKFSQNVGYDADGKLVKPVKYPSLFSDGADAEVTTSARQWGLPGDPDEQITMTRYYAAQRTLWVDPVSGTIVRVTEHANHYYARDPLKPERALADYTLKSTEQTVEAQVNAARDDRDWLALWSRILPITLAAAGLIILVGGVLLAAFGVRSEAALIDPGLDTTEQNFFESLFDNLLHRRPKKPEPPMPAAEAATEKFTAQPPERPRNPGPPDPTP